MPWIVMPYSCAKSTTRSPASYRRRISSLRASRCASSFFFGDSGLGFGYKSRKRRCAAIFGDAPDVTPEGFEDSSSASIEKAVRRILWLLYAGMELPSEPLTDYKPPKENRNREIYQRYLEGVRVVDLAAEYGISLQRVYVIIRLGKRNQW